MRVHVFLNILHSKVESNIIYIISENYRNIIRYFSNLHGHKTIIIYFNIAIPIYHNTFVLFYTLQDISILKTIIFEIYKIEYMTKHI